MSAIFTSPKSVLPLRGAMTANRSGLKSTFRRRATQILTAVAGASMLGAVANAEDAYPVEGYWVNKAGDAIVEIAPCTDSHKRLCGTVVWAASTEAGTVGDQVMTSFRLSGNKAGDKWAKGKIAFGGGKGKAGKLAVEGDALKVSVCKRANACKSNVWERPSATMTAEAGLKNGAE